jgi:pyruvate carboxylase
MDRALREFRIRGVKTNIPFLENVVNSPVFQSGRATTRFIDDTPSLFAFAPRQDRATRLLTYIADVTVNGNPEVKGKPVPERLRPAPVPKYDPVAPPPGTRQRLDELGPEGFATWTSEQQGLLLTDTTFRDAHQSLLATRVRTYDLAAIAPFVARRLSGLYSLEMWGGATFDVTMRFLLEDPWRRLRRLRELIPNVCFQMLLRASNAVGYTAYPDNAVREFVREAAAQGIDIFRIFDSLNWLPNMKVAMEAVRNTDRICEAAVCYTGDILDPARDKYPLQYYVRMAKELERMGAHVLGIKDMAGLCRPYAAETLVRALKQEIGIPIHFHTHDTSGLNAASVLKAAEAGVDVADAAVASMSGTTSQPNLNSLVAALDHTGRSTGLDLDSLNQYSDYWEAVRISYEPFDTAPLSGTAEVYLHEMPGGQYTNLRAQAESMGLGERWTEIARTYADVNRAFGDIVKVTPSSKVVGDMAIFLVTHGLTMAQFEALGESHNLTLPNSVVEMFAGSLGQPDGGWPPALQRMVLRHQQPIDGRPGEQLPPVDFEAVGREVARQIGRSPSRDEALSYVMYPDVFTKFARAQRSFGDLGVLPTKPFLYGMRTGEEILVEIEAGKVLVIRFLTVSDLRPDGQRTVFFELNGQPREVTVRDRSQRTTRAAREMADPSHRGQVGAPTPGMVTTVAVEPGQTVEQNQKLLVLEAMKMQSTVYAPVAGRVARLLVKPGQAVETKELLVIIE